MGAEILLFWIVIPIAQKVGEQWIEHIATGINENFLRLVKAIVNDPNDPEKKETLTAELRSNPKLAERLQRNITKTMQSDDTIASIAATVVPARGTKLKHYAELLRWIVRTGAKLQRDFVLKGFLNGELYLSYFIFNFDLAEIKIKKIADRDLILVESNVINCKPGFGQKVPVSIYIEKIESTEARDEKFWTINEKAERTGLRLRTDYGFRVGHTTQIQWIYEKYVTDDTLDMFQDFDKLPPTKQEELEIRTYEPIRTMVQSLGELLESRIQDDKILRETIASARVSASELLEGTHP